MIPTHPIQGCIKQRRTQLSKKSFLTGRVKNYTTTTRMHARPKNVITFVGCWLYCMNGN